MPNGLHYPTRILRTLEARSSRRWEGSGALSEKNADRLESPLGSSPLSVPTTNPTNHQGYEVSRRKSLKGFPFGILGVLWWYYGSRSWRRVLSFTSEIERTTTYANE